MSGRVPTTATARDIQVRCLKRSETTIATSDMTNSAIAATGPAVRAANISSAMTNATRYAPDTDRSMTLRRKARSRSAGAGPFFLMIRVSHFGSGAAASIAGGGSAAAPGAPSDPGTAHGSQTAHFAPVDWSAPPQVGQVMMWSPPMTRARRYRLSAPAYSQAATHLIGLDQWTEKPPSTNSTCPVTYAEAFEARNSAAPRKSSGNPLRPVIERADRALTRSGSAAACAVSGVST